MQASLTASPILVSGPGRSGSTWMQWFLSQHPEVHIHGQSPNIPWRTFWAFRATLAEQGDWAREANAQVGYDIAHYAGSRAARADDVFRRMFVHYMTGYGPRRLRWGLKWIGLSGEAGAAAQWEMLWPDTRWIICLRDPFRTIESMRSTFNPHVALRTAAEAWTAAARFALSHAPARTTIFQIDRLDRLPHEQRRNTLESIARTGGLAWCDALERFARAWTVVHKETPDAQRRFHLSEEEKRSLAGDVPGFAAMMQRLGYGGSC